MHSFNGTGHACPQCDPSEDYWRLINACGSVIQCPKQNRLRADFSPEPRVLVKFDANLNKLGLANHNAVRNSLWILESDLEPE
jgi:hypothetical protein